MDIRSNLRSTVSNLSGLEWTERHLERISVSKFAGSRGIVGKAKSPIPLASALLAVSGWRGSRGRTGPRYAAGGDGRASKPLCVAVGQQEVRPIRMHASRRGKEEGIVGISAQRAGLLPCPI